MKSLSNVLYIKGHMAFFYGGGNIRTKKIIVYILFIFIPAIILISSLYFKEKKQMLIVRNIQVEIVGKRTEAVDKYIENIDYIDDELIKLADKIILTNRDVKVEAKIDDKNAPKGANGVTIPEEKTIYINTNEYDSLTMVHEFFHLLDYSMNISGDAVFQNLMKEHEEHLDFGIYQSSSLQEEFVAVMIQYRYLPDNLKKECHETFDYVENRIEKKSK